jgi:hypothetical protein
MAFIAVYDADVAQIIVTKNLRDFPAERLGPWNLKAKSPDSFVRDQIDIDRQAVWACVQQIVDSRTRNPVTIEDVLKQLVPRQATFARSTTWRSRSS